MEEEDERKLRKLDFYIGRLLPLSAPASFLRFVFLPITLVAVFGGPQYMNLPIFIWATIYNGTHCILLLTERMVMGLRRITHAREMDTDYTAPASSEAEASIITDKDVIMEEEGAAGADNSIAKAVGTSEITTRGPEGEELGIEVVVTASPVARSEEALRVSIVDTEDQDVLYFSTFVVSTALFAVNLLDVFANLVMILVSWIMSWGIFTQSNFGSGRDVDPAWEWGFHMLGFQIAMSIICVVQHFLLFFSVTPCGACLSRGICRKYCPDHNHDTNFPSWTISKRRWLVHRLIVCWFAVLTFIAFVFCATYIGEMNLSDSNIHYTGCEAMIEGNDNGLCMFPFPSMQYLRKDDSTTTGYMFDVDATESAPPIKMGGRLNLDFLKQSYYDGFSVTGGLLWHVPGFVDNTKSADRAASQLVSHKDVSPAWKKTSLLIKVGSNELHPHFCTVDYLAEPTENRICYCQPARAMDYNAEYAVVIKGLTGTDGEILSPSPLLASYVQAYKSGSSCSCCDCPRDDADEQRYERIRSIIFPLLERNGIDLDSLQLVWDFNTISYDSSTRFARSVYAIATEKMKSQYDLSQGAGNLGEIVRRIDSEVTFSEECPAVDDGDAYDDEIAAMATYKVKVPWILLTQDYIGAEVMEEFADRGGNNNPHHLGQKTLKIKNYMLNAMPLVEVSLVVLVPCSVASGMKQVSAAVEWGHGVFADRTQVGESWLRKLANKEGWVMWAMDWRGFDRFGFPLLARAVVHNVGSPALNDLYYNLVQSVISRIAVRDFILPLLLQYDENFLQLDGNKLDNIIGGPGNTLKAHHYMGGSMGSILGGGYMHMAGIGKTVLYVGGSPLTYIIGTTSLAGLYLRGIDLQFFRRTDARLALSLLQIVIDEIETATSSEPDPVHGSYKKDVLMLAAQGDSVVTETAAEIMSRNLNVTLMTPSVDKVPVLPSGTSEEIKGSSFASKRGTRALFLAAYEKTAARLEEDDRGPPQSQPGNYVHGCFPQIDICSGIVASFLSDNLQNNADCGNTADTGCFLSDECGD